MNLNDYIKRIGKSHLSDFASRCGTTVGQLKQVAYGYRRPSASLAICIDRESCGEVVCEELRPDIDWAYLRNSASRLSVA
ncbi:YdaS family helix-turn-helix protein [Pseudomonas alliivorans]|uniref:transcriptional regulator n=1 Tax=Pseudomonas alliivorans TaxID=2810613 RepID=UPI001AE578D5|nr:YdaS family helix-turn-helix protein [Pseudomonas alliivorans]MBP0943113.1 helix-turn-helix domain-containing protein [Pseudomonas alliivorans]MEE4881209.1 YdaS family helix-turn-helix protein [Pseudomonas alliivorans]MEE4932513.1 YdaS family helix-turn-helix protein [Pseudomonas alliivorans]MEE4937976.1 YdaS family helix-turn-helix protein [Pseudomonas alliivorans]MEE4943091.1 YdaS family helix-turn-helix protein [Pseudomonas alliivorans]